MGICAYIHTIMLDSKVKFFKALGDETRLTILSYLLEHSYCACDFSSLTKKDQTTVSKHLKVLVEAGILKYEKQGRNIIYSIKNEEINCLLLSLGIRDIKPCCDGQHSSRVCSTDKTEIRINNTIKKGTNDGLRTRHKTTSATSLFLGLNV